MEDTTSGRVVADGWRSALDILTSVILATVAVYVGWHYWGGEDPPLAGGIPIPAEAMSVAGAAVKGAPDAPIVMIEFSDFECPFCARFTAGILPELEREYITPGRVALAFRHLPLSFHRSAALAGAAAECAGEQGRFWSMHDRLFERGVKGIDRTGLQQMADSIGLDAARLDACLDGDATTRVADDTVLAASLGITGTPGFLIGRRLPDGRVQVSHTLSGTHPIDEFRRTLDAALAEDDDAISWGASLTFGLVLVLVASAITIVRRSAPRRRSLAATS
jgi:protein-disulfide isomerase